MTLSAQTLSRASPLPHWIKSSTKIVYAIDPVGAGLPAKAPVQSPLSYEPFIFTSRHRQIISHMHAIRSQVRRTWLLIKKFQRLKPQLRLRTRQLPPAGHARRRRPTQGLPLLLSTGPPRHTPGTDRLRRRDCLVRPIQRLRQNHRPDPRRQRTTRPAATVSGAIFRRRERPALQPPSVL